MLSELTPLEPKAIQNHYDPLQLANKVLTLGGASASAEECISWFCDESEVGDGMDSISPETSFHPFVSQVRTIVFGDLMVAHGGRFP